MKIKSLKLTNFRNFLKLELNFISPTIIIVGPNGRGKTNLLEAIYQAGTTKSFRTIYNTQLINYQADFCRIEILTKPQTDPQFLIEVAINRNPARGFLKKFKINHVTKKLTQALGKIKVVFFSPESLNLITGSPTARRKYLDLLISLVDKKYLRLLLVLFRVLKNRNKLLEAIGEGRSEEGELNFWNKELARVASYIILRRWQVTKFLSSYSQESYREISQKLEDRMRIKYLSRPMESRGDWDKLVADKFQKEIFIIMRKMITEKQSQEIAQGRSLIGPQRDNLIFVLNDHDLSAFGSRGEVRSAILALKIAEAQYLAQKSSGEPPVLLLDDVFSELDQMRRKKLLKLINKTQTFITTTELGKIDPALKKKAQIIKLV